MKLFFIGIAIAIFGISSSSCAQESPQQQQQQQPTEQNPPGKLELFISKSGSIVKFEDYNCPKIVLQFGFSASTRIRKVITGEGTKLFYQISHDGKYTTYTASIALEDFNELKKAVLILRDQVKSDLKSPADYLENRFISEEGFRFGYYVEKGKATWFMKLERFGNGNSIVLRNAESIDESFKYATDKLSELN